MVSTASVEGVPLSFLSLLDVPIMFRCLECSPGSVNVRKNLGVPSLSVKRSRRFKRFFLMLGSCLRVIKNDKSRLN